MLGGESGMLKCLPGLPVTRGWGEVGVAEMSARTCHIIT